MQKIKELRDYQRNNKKLSWIIAVLVVSTLLFGCIRQSELDDNELFFVDELIPTNPLQSLAQRLFPEEIGQFDDGGNAWYVQVVGHLAFIADDSDGLEIIDISDPTAPCQVGQFDDGGYAYGVQVVGPLAYVCDGTDGLEIINISNPAAPFEVGYFNDGGAAYSVQVVGPLAYLADDTDGLEIIDISDPTAPTQVGEVYDGGMARGLQVVGSLAYVADVTGGLEIIDISNPASPNEIGYFDDGGLAYDVEVIGTLAYVADGFDGLEIIDITNPAAPSQVGQFDDGGTSLGVQVVGTLAYVADGADSFEIINVANPATPTKLREVANGGYGRDIQVVGTLAYLANEGGGLKILDLLPSSLSPWKNVAEVAHFPDGSFGSGYDIEVMGSLAYVADGWEGLEILDVTDPFNPTMVTELYDAGQAWAVDVVGSLVYVADYDDGLEIIDVTNPYSPTEIGQSYDGSGTALDVQVVGPLAFVADAYDGLEIVDVTNPSAPIKLANITDGYQGYARSVHVVGPLAYVADSGDGLEIIDITNPSSPTEIGQFDDGGNAYRVQVVGDLAYVADRADGLEIINISTPSAPTQVGQLVAGGQATDVQVVGSLAFVADQSDGVEIIDVSDPTAPILVGKFNDWSSGWANYLYVESDLVYVGASADGLKILEGYAPWASNSGNATYIQGTTEYITWTLSDNFAGHTYRVLLEGAVHVNWSSWTNNIAFNIPIDTGTIGIWNYTIEYDDSAGLWGPPNTVFITIDTPPDASTPANATHAQGTTANITWTISDNGAGGAYQVLKNTSPYSNWIAWTSDIAFNVTIDTSELGLWNYTLQYNDSLGLWGSPSTVFITIEDQTAPWASNPSGATYPWGSSVVINWTLYDNIAGGTYQVLRNSSSHDGWTTWTNNVSFLVTLATDELGVWNYTIHYNDSIGLWGVPNTVFITIEDQTAPWASEPNNATHAQGSIAVINWTLYDNVAGGTYQVLRNNSGHGDWNTWTNNVSFLVTLATDELGIWNYTIQYNDSAGLLGAPNTVFITIEDQTVPWASAPADATHAPNSTAVITWTLYDNIAGGTYQVLRNGNPYSSWTAWTTNIPFNVTIDTSELGVWNYTIQYNDSAGFWGTPNTVLITIKAEEGKGGIPAFSILFGLLGLLALVIQQYSRKQRLKLL